ncbi:MAG: TIGR04283 family arsenosugar biosynthesis glycosyltransferase [Synergistaceae bacterium]|jgi:rSAM/selenodomain-associated transferase 2|nr:TIGR04283 family arsenosugar biosynthesis glycosyltransferase [Synergistaceae bacterium]
MISIIVPLYNEEKTITNLLLQLSRLAGAHEILLADGGSTDRTRELAQEMLSQEMLSQASLSKARLLGAPRGRAAQSNAAAREAAGEILFFLHADSQIQPDTLGHIEKAVSEGATWGCLTLRFDEEHPLTALCAYFSNLRVRLARIAFGDQGIFIRRDAFLKESGFPELPLMEDYEFSLRLRRRRIFPVQLPCPIVTSARRFREHGRLRTLFLMWRLRRLYRKGCDIQLIAARYRQVR